MTDVSKVMHVLPLQGSPERQRMWLIVLAFGVPAIVVLGILGAAIARDAPILPVLITVVFVFGVCGAITLWILRMIRSIAVTLDGETLVVDTGIAKRRFSLSALRANGLRVVSFAEHVELRPVLRTWGIGMPGLASGWFRLRNAAKALCILTGRERVTALRAEDGTWILLSLADPAPLRAVLGR